MSPPQQPRQRTSNCSSLLIYRSRKDERLSWPSWLTHSGWCTHISGHPSATGRAQASESTPAKDRCSTAGPRNLSVHVRMYRVFRWRGGATGKAFGLAISRSQVQILLEATPRNNLRQVVYTYVPLSPSSITWYRPEGGDALRLVR